MFRETGALYDAFYDAQGKDYAAEAARIVELVEERVSDARTLLDVACGTGRHLERLSARFDCSGVDLDEGLLDIARGRLKQGSLSPADMCDFDLGGTFDVVTCLFSSIGYTKTEARMRDAIACMARHVAPGGLLVIEPWFRPDLWIPGTVHALFVNQPELKAARMSHSDPAVDGVSVVDMHYLVASPAGVERFFERHELGLFTDEQYAAALADAGLDVELVADGLIGRGLFLGSR